MKYIYEDVKYPSFYEGVVNDKIEARLDSLVQEFKIHKCICCGASLNFDHVDMYNHDGGWFITPEIPKQWLSVHCDNCNYDISFTKLGVRR